MSSAYRELTSEYELVRVVAETETAWQDASLPISQYDIVRQELEHFRIYKTGEPFSGFARCMDQLSPYVTGGPTMRLLDVGASGGYYGEICKMIGWRGTYTAYDSSEAFAALARGIYPDIEFDLGDARSLPYHDEWFDVILTSGTIMHIYEWPNVIAELARVSSRYVILHRTPISFVTRYYEKQAYGVPCLEIHFNEESVLAECRKAGLIPIYQTTLSSDPGMKYAMKSYVLEKPAIGIRHFQV